MYKRIKVHLGQGQDLIVSIEIYLKYKYTYENAGFCVLSFDDFKILKKFYKPLKFSTFFTEKRHRCQPPSSQRPYDVSHRQNRYVTLLLIKRELDRHRQSCPYLTCLFSKEHYISLNFLWFSSGTKLDSISFPAITSNYIVYSLKWICKWSMKIQNWGNYID